MCRRQENSPIKKDIQPQTTFFSYILLKNRSEDADYIPDSGTEAEKFADSAYAYLKIAEGCNRGCTYCVIPDIRGPYRSMQPEAVLRDARTHLAAGAKELIVVAQDITSYGRDIPDYSLSRLLRNISSIEGDFWIRLLYLYPASITDELLGTIQGDPKICNYIDMPIQHSEERILKMMGRGGSRAQLVSLIGKIRDRVPGVALRTSFITGFPGETEEEFGRLVEFISEVEFDRLGVFKYSREEGTPAFALKGQIPKRIKQERYERIMETQSSISLKKNMELIGREFRALVDDAGSDAAVARLYSHAPEIDGVVLLDGEKLEKGGFVQVRITEAYDYDLKAAVSR